MPTTHAPTQSLICWMQIRGAPPGLVGDSYRTPGPDSSFRSEPEYGAVGNLFPIENYNGFPIMLGEAPKLDLAAPTGSDFPRRDLGRCPYAET